MSIETHINSLAQKRAELKARISLEMARPLPDFKLITEMKKLNLTLKEEMRQYLIMLGTADAHAG